MQILLDGMDVRTVPLQWLRRQMGLVSQVPLLFPAHPGNDVLTRTTTSLGSMRESSARSTLRVVPAAASSQLDANDAQHHSRATPPAAGLQEPTLFQTTIYNNIVYGNPDATPEQVHAAARDANAHDFITALPSGCGANMRGIS